MEYLHQLPWTLHLDDHELDAALFEVEKDTAKICAYKCEYQDDREHGPCHPAPYAIGTSDPREPKFCLTHYFAINDGDGKSNYKIVADKN